MKLSHGFRANSVETRKILCENVAAKLGCMLSALLRIAYSPQNARKIGIKNFKKGVARYRFDTAPLWEKDGKKPY